MMTPHVPMVPMASTPMTAREGGASEAARTLPLTAVRVDADARGGLGRVVLTQVFRNPHDVPLQVTYAFPLPEDAAVSGYAFTIGDVRVVGEIDRREAARQRFEEAILEGKTSALLEEDRTTLFTQEIGNVPAGAEVTIELTIDQRLIWTSEEAWEWRFPTAAAPRYLGAEGRVADAARVTIDVADAPLAVRASLALSVRDALAPAQRVESSSHRIASTERNAVTRVTLEAVEGALLDRDLVVRWGVDPARRASIDVARPAHKGDPKSAPAEASYGVLTIVPPSRKPGKMGLPRDLVVLLDTSGSMGGAPLDQARRIASALIATLDETDRLELIEFSSATRRWKKGAVAANAANRQDALAWLASLQASGGTEMRDGILGALGAIRSESQRQVILVTDGQIGFEREVVASIFAKLPPGACLHTVGVGSAVNRSLTASAARAGRGTEVIVGLGEDPERAAKRIVASTEAPLVVDVRIEGSAVLGTAAAKCPALYAATPVLAAVKLRPEGGEVVVRGRTEDGTWEQRVSVPAFAPGDGGQGVVALFGREQVLDLDMQGAAGHMRAPAVDRAIEAIGLAFQIATRMTSWVAISDDVTVDKTSPTRRVRVPQSLPHGMSAAGLGLRSAASSSGAAVGAMAGGFAPRVMRAMAAPPSPAPLYEERSRGRSMPAPSQAKKSVEPPAQAMRPAAPSQSPPGILERGVAIVKGFFASTPNDPPERTFQGTIVRRQADELVIEFAIADAPFAWTPTGHVVLVWEDGTTSSPVITAEAPARSIAPGETMRIYLRLDAHDQARAGAAIGTAILHDGRTHVDLTA